MRAALVMGFFLWVAEILWLPVALEMDRWQAALWAEATVSEAMTPELRHIARGVEDGMEATLTILAAPVRMVTRDRTGRTDLPGYAMERSARAVARIDFMAALRFEARLIMKRTGTMVTGFVVLTPLLFALFVDGFARRRIRAATMRAPKPVLFNFCWLVLVAGFFLTGFVLPWPVPFPPEVWGLVPVIVGVILHRAVMHYHRFL